MSQGTGLMSVQLFEIYKNKSAVPDRISIPVNQAIVNKFDEVFALAMNDSDDSRHFETLTKLVSWGEAFSLGQTIVQPETFPCHPTKSSPSL